MCEWSRAANEQARKTASQAIAVHWLKRKVGFVQATLSTSANIATSHALSISLSALCTLRASPASASTCDPIRLHCATKLLDISYGGYYHGATSNKGIQAKDQVGLQDVQVSVDFGHTPTCRYWQGSHTCRLSPDEGYLKQADRPSTSSSPPIDDRQSPNTMDSSSNLQRQKQVVFGYDTDARWVGYAE